jgi:hypothetical protein
MLFFLELVAAMIVAWCVAPFVLWTVLGMLGGLWWLCVRPKAFFQAHPACQVSLVPASLAVLWMLLSQR